MNQQEIITQKLFDALFAQNPSEEQKLIKALLKIALHTDDLIAFIKQANKASNGKGKVKAETVKGAVEYFKVKFEVEIRNAKYTKEEKDDMVKRNNDQMTGVVIRLLGFLANQGLLD